MDRKSNPTSSFYRLAGSVLPGFAGTMLVLGPLGIVTLIVLGVIIYNNRNEPKKPKAESPYPPVPEPPSGADVKSSNWPGNVKP